MKFRLFLGLVAVSVAVCAAAPKYVFLFIGDGMSTPQRMVAEEFSRATGTGPLAMNALPYQCTTRTRAANAVITDSAAAATAIACGEKANNGALGITPDGRRLESVAALAKKRGMKVGILTTVPIVHATPAGFYAHRTSRGDSYGIALDLLASKFDFFAGGGVYDKFDDKSHAEYRGNVFDLAARDGYAVVRDKASFAALKPGCGKVWGVFAKDASMGATGSLALPVLTMPGIAGLVLTLGMAVDANVIIFERIREEFAAKASVGTALRNGYGHAFTAILDSNITTIVTGVILFSVGTGPVRGFAITLTAGVIISMFTAVVVTRLVFDNTTNPEAMKPFRMLSFFKKTPNIDFVRFGKLATFVSFGICFLVLAVFFVRAFVNTASVFAVDLTGGTSIVYSVDKQAKPSVGEIRKVLDAFDNAAVIQYQEGVGDPTLLVKTGETAETKKGLALENHDVGAHVTKMLQDAFKDAKIKQVSVDEVGSMVGADLKKSGTWAVVLSLCAILIYVAFRFEFGFGLGALVALAHDVFISLGLFSLCGRQVSLLVITALLTIIGYSVDDTIVVFDRIREDLRKDQKTDFKALCNRALNECISRTVITSLTTFFAVMALFAFGDGSIFDFALTMIIGVVAGTFSSMFIATPVMMWFYKGRRPQFNKETAVEQK